MTKSPFKTILWISIGATLMFTAAAAVADNHMPKDTFTFESTSNPPISVGGTSDQGQPYMGMYWTGTSTGKMSNGKTTKTSFSCVMMSQPPTDSIFKAHMICDVDAGDGTYSAVMGCQYLNTSGTEASCIGGLYGKTGAYQGRRGSITNHAKDGKSNGTGQWFG